jgi:hypothetical protein
MTPDRKSEQRDRYRSHDRSGPSLLSRQRQAFSASAAGSQLESADEQERDNNRGDYPIWRAQS